jgi:dolichol-phosphate mannosyltransferase
MVYVEIPGDWMGAETLVIIPTYNERENLPQILRRLLELSVNLDVLVVDDSSPDGTG